MGTDRLSYLISNQQNQVIALRSYQLSSLPNESPLEQVLLEDSILQAKFRTVRAGLFSPKFSSVPLSLFNKEEVEIYLQQTTSLETQDQVSFDVIDSLKAANVYAFEIPYIRDF